jgi:dynein heavy chain 1
MVIVTKFIFLGIKKQHLTEVRSMGNPPAAVKLAMESVCIMLGHHLEGWKTVQQIIRRDDFITSIVNFDTDKMLTPALRERMEKEFLSNPDYNFETVNRASKACGPLVQWAIAQVRFSSILDKVGPLREEVTHLEQSAEETRLRAELTEKMITELEERISHLKDEYAVLITETQTIKTEMERVKSKVDRSMKLIDNLSAEKDRWKLSSDSFDSQIRTVAGDVMIAAAFSAYSGYFDQQYRDSLHTRWTDHMKAAGIHFRPELSLIEYLSTADERHLWHANALPSDELCEENALMLSHFNRYPLIIDPSSQALTFLMNQFKDRKVMVTSFVDDSFLKNLESALR